MNNIVKDTEDNIKAVCRILCDREDITTDERVYYAQIAGFERQKDKAGNEYFEFNQKYNKATYLHALADVLFVEKPKEYTRSEVITALDFFLNSFGEISYSAWRYWNGLDTNPILKAMNLTGRSVDGEKDIKND